MIYVVDDVEFIYIFVITSIVVVVVISDHRAREYRVLYEVGFFV